MCVLRVQLYGQLPLTLIIDTDLTVTDCDWLLSPQLYVEVEVMARAAQLYCRSNVHLCLLAASGRRGRPPLRIELQFGAV